MKIISILSDLSTNWRRGASGSESRLRWLRDPLAHPALEAMSERELADLPFGRARHAGDERLLLRRDSVRRTDDRAC